MVEKFVKRREMKGSEKPHTMNNLVYMVCQKATLSSDFKVCKNMLR